MTSRVRTLVPRVKLEVCDLDACFEKDEVMKALKRELPDAKENFEVTLTKVNARRLRLAIVKFDERHAIKLIEAAKLRMGWVPCRVRLRTDVRRCYKCLGFGHWTSQWKGPERHDLCFRCKTERHKSDM